MSLPPIHRVVTGHDAEGKAIVAHEGPLSTVVELQALAGMVFHEVWETSGMPARVSNDPDPTTGPTMHGAPELGTRIRFVDLPPDSSYLGIAESKIKQLFDELNGREGLTVKPDSPHRMMHRSEAIDYCIVISGEITLVLDDSEVHLKPGNVVVQRGTNHAWANRSDTLCRMLFVQIDGQYDPSIAAAIARHQHP